MALAHLLAVIPQSSLQSRLVADLSELEDEERPEKDGGLPRVLLSAERTRVSLPAEPIFPRSSLPELSGASDSLTIAS
eukprot:747657-Hanusia_phi.AAC.2